MDYCAGPVIGQHAVDLIPPQQVVVPPANRHRIRGMPGQLFDNVPAQEAGPAGNDNGGSWEAHH
jgi:hypothetical protein